MRLFVIPLFVFIYLSLFRGILSKHTYDVECIVNEIRVYSWNGQFDNGDCWYSGLKFMNGDTWGTKPFCLCENGQIRVFYTQISKPDDLTILRPSPIYNQYPQYNLSPTSQDLAKWPIPDYRPGRSKPRKIICSQNRTNIRVRARNGCIGCRCSKNGNWLCRIPPKKRKATLKKLTLKVNECRAPSSYCVLAERFTENEQISRYVELENGDTWYDQTKCTNCTCTSGRFVCSWSTDLSCPRACLLQKIKPVFVTYYFPNSSKWTAPSNERCRQCYCINGQRKCYSCDTYLSININTDNQQNDEKDRQKQYYASPYILQQQSTDNRRNQQFKTHCIIKISANSHRLVQNKQRTIVNNKCYECQQGLVKKC
ncbi:unnamed protein product [Didymodactylos carnosus]|uniref:Uncharacterized protein n=1 Tax=Didymodactylos carnosus TaxID=1234261 RepID=A0A814I0H5_9BILA|nr:unnamed protein product [Didymodactylos carnosus]CAF1016493.1 unnamed protein product [Didymodactylos carnosus]CAF3502250.1 unnamed protein product [Didymodactylos carnosus]CAF3788032.1 unnamed protein product [Didymodactylos carnosus]